MKGSLGPAGVTACGLPRPAVGTGLGIRLDDEAQAGQGLLSRAKRP